ncbi:sigma-70 family RNA polymerase sigma factor [Streptomyces klenkii]|uniref:Sigma-70 family RNA polymerase sigma factor n=1 Tax=Streptomyces klenkii TaxID=1420899 RepID=A0A3B0BCQ6_9ACTN|nr:sigma-70 family RNA polymerase sigma factor [Streptomyces klenkii]
MRREDVQVRVQACDGRPPGPWPALREDLSEALPADFVAFFSLLHRPYLRYAHLQLDSEPDAEWVVEEVFSQLALAWGEVRRHPNPAAYALAALKEKITKLLAARRRGATALVETAAFAAVREASRARLEVLDVLESRLGVYGAINRLPDRQYDVVLLRYVLGYPAHRVAAIMGITPATVRSHVRGARRRLAHDLEIAWTPEAPEGEEEA